MQEKLDQLKRILGVVADLNAATALLDWDQQTYMPTGAVENRGYQIGTLSSQAHSKFISDEVGALLAELKPYGETLDSDSDDACLIRVTDREYQKAVKVPSEYVEEFSRVTVLAHGAWEEARAKNDFPHFQPHLEKIVELRRQYADFFAPFDHVYDPLLDDFEPGMKTAAVQKIFSELRPKQVELLQAIAEKDQVDDSFLHLHYEGGKQWTFGEEAITKYGYDWKHGRQDKAAHPFTTSFGLGDVRITTRVDENFLIRLYSAPCTKPVTAFMNRELPAGWIGHLWEQVPRWRFMNPNLACLRIYWAGPMISGSIFIPVCKRSSPPSWVMWTWILFIRGSIKWSLL